MVRRLIDLFNKEFSGLHQAAFLLGLSSLISQLLGLFRDRLLAHNFGATTQLDIYYAAFRIPDIIFVSVGSFLAVTVIIPILVEKIEHQSAEEVKSFLSALLTLFLTVITAVSVLAYIFAPYLTELVAPGFDVEAKGQLITMTRILLLSPFFLGLSNLFGAVTQAHRRFFVYAISPVLYNVGIIIGVLLFYPSIGLEGLVYGVVLGAGMHFLAQVPIVIREGYVPVFNLGFLRHDMLRVVRLSLPRTVALGANQLSLAALLAIASLMTAGSISVFNFAFNLQSVPMALIGISYSVAAFPTMSKLFSSGQRDAFVSYMAEALKHIIFWSLPIAVLFVILRAQIVRTILGSGNFTWTHTRLTAALLAVFSLTVVFQSIIHIFDRAYYATGRTKQPVIIKVSSALLTIVLALMLGRFLSYSPLASGLMETILRVSGVPGTEVLLLGMAYAVGTLFNAVLLWISFERDIKIRFSGDVARTVGHALSSSLILGISSSSALRVLSTVLDLRTFWGIFLQGLLAGIAGLVVWVAFLLAIGNEEINSVAEVVSKRLSGKRPIIPGPEQL